MSEPARFGTLIFGLIVLAGLALVIARTGNDAGVGVSGSELKMRAILDRIMPVRPRTKEFLVGHPAFVLGICWWLRGRRRLAVPAVVIGSLGQVSLLNTFCHIHTPMIISAWRDVIGLIVGSVIGLALFFIGERIAGTRGEPL
jgi:Na+/proline symporter